MNLKQVVRSRCENLEELAEKLGKTKQAVSQQIKASESGNTRLITLLEIVEAMGGKLQINLLFEDESFNLEIKPKEKPTGEF